jgi:uncharacterized phage-associated protein
VPATKTIRFRFDERKAAAAASVFIGLAGGQMDYFDLLKQLYYADRESLDLTGRPITGDRLFSMKDGPVLSRVYDLMKAAYKGQPIAGPWSEHIEAKGRYGLKMRGTVETGPLSERELKIIKDVFARHREYDKWALRNKTHKDLPEWTHPGKTSKEIRIEDLLRTLGKSDDQIAEVAQNAKDGALFGSIFRV